MAIAVNDMQAVEHCLFAKTCPFPLITKQACFTISYSNRTDTYSLKITG